MLISILISITPTSPAPIMGPLGRPANAWFLRQITRCRLNLAQKLHSGSGLRPYTVSPLLDDRGHPLQAGRWVNPGESVWLRWTVFSPELSETVLKEVLPELPVRLDLYKMKFRLDGYTLDPAKHPWAGQTSYVDLAQIHKGDAVPRQVRLAFTSPTAFRSQGADIPLPIPASVFRSYWQKWNSSAQEPMVINPLWPQFCAACVTVSELVSINTERWKFAEGTKSATTGFTGMVEFKLLPKHQCGEWGSYWDDAAQVLNTLSEFAFYCGTGHHCTAGMGQTRLVKGTNVARNKFCVLDDCDQKPDR